MCALSLLMFSLLLRGRRLNRGCQSIASMPNVGDRAAENSLRKGDETAVE